MRFPTSKSATASAGPQLRLSVAAAIVVLAALLAPQRLVAQATGKIVADWWDAAYMQSARCGYVHMFLPKGTVEADQPATAPTPAPQPA